MLGAKLVHSASRLTGTGSVEESVGEGAKGEKGDSSRKKKDLTKKFADKAKASLGKRASVSQASVPSQLADTGKASDD